MCSTKHVAAAHSGNGTVWVPGRHVTSEWLWECSCRTGTANWLGMCCELIYYAAPPAEYENTLFISKGKHPSFRLCVWRRYLEDIHTVTLLCRTSLVIKIQPFPLQVCHNPFQLKKNTLKRPKKRRVRKAANVQLHPFHHQETLSRHFKTLRKALFALTPACPT